MNQTEISNLASKMTSANDLAELLTMIKRDEFGSDKAAITEAQLKYFANEKVPKRYRTFHIRKKNGGQREINAPSYPLAIILHTLNSLFQSIYKPDNVVCGFAPGRSVVDNAKSHIGHNYVFNIDLKDFFSSIPQARVWKRLQLPPFNFTREIANVAAGLCCNKNENKAMNVLPQGAATSPLLTNAICDKLDRRMKGVAKRFGLHYSRYADDMTFSSMHNVYQEGSDFRNEIKRIIEEQGFTMNDNKTRLYRNGQRQEVTGLTVNEIANVSRQYISDLRWMLHIWEKEGYAKAYAMFYPKYKYTKGYIKKGEPVMENVISGKLNYLKLVKGANNAAYQKLAKRFERLRPVVFIDNETDKSSSFVFVHPYEMKEFQKLFNTQICLEVSPKRKLVGKCVIAGMNKTLSIGKSTQNRLCPNLAELQPGHQVEAAGLRTCYVTLCRSKGKNFWLITSFEPHGSKCLSVQYANLNIDEILDVWGKEGFDAAVEYFRLSLEYGDITKL